MPELFDIHGEHRNTFIDVSQEHNQVTFTIQQGPILDNGVNGCQIDDVVGFARDTINSFNERFPCRENAIVITKLDEAIHWMEHRKKNRVSRGVEGKDEL